MSKINLTDKSTSYPEGTSLKPQILSTVLSGRGAGTGCLSVDIGSRFQIVLEA